MQLNELPPGVRESLLNRIDGILSKGGTVKRREMDRLVDYELTGTQPTVGTLNRDPAQVTAEQNLAKLAQGNYIMLVSMAIIELSIATALLGSSHCYWKRNT